MNDEYPAGGQAAGEHVDAGQDDQDAGGTVVHYHFPIEVVVVGEIGEEVAWQIEERIWQQLHDALS